MAAKGRCPLESCRLLKKAGENFAWAAPPPEEKITAPLPAATRARWAGPCGGAPARGASPKQSFRPPFSKGGGFQRQRLWPLAAASGTLYTLGVFGGLGAFTRERPPRPLPIPPFPGGKRPPRWGGGPAGARGGPSFVFAACGRPAGSPSSFFLLEFSGSDRKSTRLNSSHQWKSRMPSSA